MERSNKAAGILRGILWLLLPFAALWGLMFLMAGMSFGFNLFRIDDPWPTVLWVLVLALPVAIFYNLRVAGDNWQRLALTLVGTVGFAAFFAFIQIK